MVAGGLLGAFEPLVTVATAGRATPFDACERDEAVEDWLRLPFGDVLVVVVGVVVCVDVWTALVWPLPGWPMIDGQRSLSNALLAFFSLSSRFIRWLLAVSSSSKRSENSRFCVCVYQKSDYKFQFDRDIQGGSFERVGSDAANVIIYRM